MKLFKHDTRCARQVELGLYTYIVFPGKHLNIQVETGDSVWKVNADTVEVISGPAEVDSYHMAVIIRGYSPG